MCEDLARTLLGFTGTERYHRYHSNSVLTDGALYLAEQGRCFWLMDVFASYLPQIKQSDNYVAVLNLTRSGSGAEIAIDDGDENVLFRQSIAFTDFPLQEIKLYACFAGEFWVIMLTSEY